MAGADLRSVVEQRALCNLQTQIIEDFNGQQTNSSHVGQGRRFRKPSVCMSTVLQADIVATKHRFKNVALGSALDCQDKQLSVHAFQPEKKRASFDFSNIASTSASPPWHSTTANQMMVPHSDLAMLHDAKKSGTFGAVSKAWLNEVCNFQHRLAIGFRNASGAYDWYLRIHPMVKSAAILWPVLLQAVDGTNYQYFEPVINDNSSVAMKGIFSLEDPDVMGATFVWRSWLWQEHSLPNDWARSHRPAIRPFLSSHGLKPMKEICCLSAWWSLSQSSIKDYADYFNVIVDSGGTLADTLWVLTQKILKAKPEDTLDILRQRLATSEASAEGSTALLEVDEAWDVVDPIDRSKVLGMQKEATSTLRSHNAFRDEYFRRAAELNNDDKKNKHEGPQTLAFARSPHIANRGREVHTPWRNAVAKP